jgi:hypothetical protein
MRCANPQCACESPYLRDGSLHLLELETPANRRLYVEESGFPMRASPQRYFWLCGECTKVFSITKWTPSRVVLTPRKQYISTIDQGSPKITGITYLADSRDLAGSHEKSQEIHRQLLARSAHFGMFRPSFS